MKTKLLTAAVAATTLTLAAPSAFAGDGWHLFRRHHDGYGQQTYKPQPTYKPSYQKTSDYGSSRTYKPTYRPSDDYRPKPRYGY